MFELDTIINEFLIQKYIDGFTQLNHEHTLENNDVFSNFLIRNFCALLVDYETLIKRFFRGKKKFETKKRIEEMNISKNNFMKSLNVCKDIKRHIYSFL